MATAIVEGGVRGRSSLTVLYDDRCRLCRRLREWLGDQAKLTAIQFIGADSHEAHLRFPDLDHHRTTRVLTVVTSEGAVYEGERAWLVCGWALPAWQPVVEHFGTGLRFRFARVAARVIDGYRHRLIARNAPCERCDIASPARHEVRQ